MGSTIQGLLHLLDDHFFCTGIDRRLQRSGRLLRLNSPPGGPSDFAAAGPHVVDWRLVHWRGFNRHEPIDQVLLTGTRSVFLSLDRQATAEAVNPMARAVGKRISGRLVVSLSVKWTNSTLPVSSMS